MYVEWNNVKFFNGFMQVMHNDKWYKINDNRSQVYFEYLKLSLQRFRNSKLLVLFDKEPNFIAYVVNGEILEEIFDFLQIEVALTNEDISNPTYFAKTVLGGWSNDQLLRAFKPQDRTPYLKHLCEVYSAMYRIVPVRETRLNDSTRTTVIEDAFLFPIYNHQWLYILWESVEEKRSTYVFRCQPANYTTAVQRVFDYVASPDITNKRDRLRQGEVGYFKDATVQYYKSIHHDDLDSWIHRLSQTCH